MAMRPPIDCATRSVGPTGCQNEALAPAPGRNKIMRPRMRRRSPRAQSTQGGRLACQHEAGTAGGGSILGAAATSFTEATEPGNGTAKTAEPTSYAQARRRPSWAERRRFGAVTDRFGTPG